MNTNKESQGVVELSAEQVRPWVRYWAKMIDLLFFGFIIGLLLVLIIIVTGIDLSYIFEIPEFLWTIFTMFLYLFFEPLLLSTWGTTLGRFLLKVKLRNRDGSKLSYKNGFIRTVTLWFRGLGLSIPFVSLVTLIVAHGKLIDNHETSWDRDGDFVVTHQKIGLLRVFLLLVPLFLLAYFILSPTK